MEEELADQLQYDRFSLISTAWVAIKISITTQAFLQFADMNDLIITVTHRTGSMCVCITEAPKPAEVEDGQSHVPN